MAQLDLTFNLKQTPVSKITDAFAIAYNYQEMVIDENGNQIPNPESKQQFTKRMIKEYIANIVDGVERTKAIQEINITKVDIE